MRALLLFARVALRNVRRNARRSFLTILAIAFGLLCLVVFQALKVGLHDEMVRSTVQLDAGALQVHAAGYEPNMANLQRIGDEKAVAAALVRAGAPVFARRLKASALALAGGRSAAVLLAGVVPAEEREVTIVAGALVRGSYLAEAGGVLVGEELSRSLGLDLGSTLSLAAQNGMGFPVTGDFRVTGVYRTALASFDRGHVFLTLPDAQRFLGAEGAVTEFGVRAAPEAGEGLARAVEGLLPAAAYQVRTWEQVAPDVRQLIELNDATMRLLVVIVFAIIAMGIGNTMTLVVFERFRELGILAAIGTTPPGILALVAFESLFLGVMGAAAGSAVALGACAYLAQHGIDLTSLTSSNQYFATSHVLRARLLLPDLAAANAVTLLTALAGGLYPAWKAARLDPVDAINPK